MKTSDMKTSDMKSGDNVFSAGRDFANIYMANRVVRVMNELLRLDPAAVQELCERLVSCNEALAGHPTAQVRGEGGSFSIGLLGVLNAVCGRYETGMGAVAAVVGGGGRIERFITIDPEGNESSLPPKPIQSPPRGPDPLSSRTLR